MLTTRSYPTIQIYRYHLAAIVASETSRELTATGESIQATVPANHPELPMLIRAGQERREEIKNGIGARPKQEITH
jgi:hypothetical protein